MRADYLLWGKPFYPRKVVKPASFVSPSKKSRRQEHKELLQKLTKIYFILLFSEQEQLIFFF